MIKKVKQHFQLRKQVKQIKEVLGQQKKTSILATFVEDMAHFGCYNNVNWF